MVWIPTRCWQRACPPGPLSRAASMRQWVRGARWRRRPAVPAGTARGPLPAGRPAAPPRSPAPTAQRSCSTPPRDAHDLTPSVSAQPATINNTSYNFTRIFTTITSKNYSHMWPIRRCLHITIQIQTLRVTKISPTPHSLEAILVIRSLLNARSDNISTAKSLIISGL